MIEKFWEAPGGLGPDFRKIPDFAIFQINSPGVYQIDKNP